MAVLKRPKLKKREPDVQTWTPPGPAASGPSAPANVYVPSPNAPAAGGRITVGELNAALGLGGAATPVSSTPKSGGINVADLGFALTGGGAAGGANASSESTRHTSYPQGKGDLSSLPVRAGTRRGPRTTSYRIPLQRNAQANVYDTVN